MQLLLFMSVPERTVHHLFKGFALSGTLALNKQQVIMERTRALKCHGIPVIK